MKKYTKHSSLIIYILLNTLHSVKPNEDDDHLITNFEINLSTEASGLKTSPEYFEKLTSINSDISTHPEDNFYITPESVSSFSENEVTSMPSKFVGNELTTQMQYLSQILDKTTSLTPVTIKSTNKNWKSSGSRILFIPKKNFKKNNIQTTSKNDAITVKNTYDHTILEILTTPFPEKINSQPLPYKNLIKTIDKAKNKDFLSDLKSVKYERKLDEKKINFQKKLGDRNFFPERESAKMNDNNNISLIGNSLPLVKKLEPISEQVADVLQSPEGLDPLLTHEENDLFTRWSSEEQEIEMEQSVAEGGIISNTYDVVQKNYLLQLRGNTTIVGIRPRDFIKYLKLNLAARLSLEYDQVRVVGVHIVPASQAPLLLRNEIKTENRTEIKFKNSDPQKDHLSKLQPELDDRVEVNLTLIFNQQNANCDLNALTRTTLLELSGHEYIIEGLLPSLMNSNSPEQATDVRSINGTEFVGALLAALVAAGVFIIIIRLHHLRSKNFIEHVSPDNLAKASVIYKGFYGQEPYIYTEIDPPGTPRQMKLNIFTCRPGSILVPSKRGIGGNINMKASDDFYDTHMQSNLINSLEK